MGLILLPVPQVGQPNSTEDPKVSSGLGIIQNVINGHIDDVNRATPNSGVRRLLLQANGMLGGGLVTGDWLFIEAGEHQSGVVLANTAPIWVPDKGLSSQPKDFQVAGKAAWCLIRAAVATNATAPATTYKIGLYQITGTTGGSSDLAYTFGTQVSGSSVSIASPAANTLHGLETAPFPMPSTGIGYGLGVQFSVGAATNSAVYISAQLYGYNS